MKILFALAVLATVACKDKPDAKPSPSAQPPTASRFEIAVTEKGFEPDDVKVPAGKPVTLVFNRKTDSTCAKEVIIKIDDKTKIERDLPLDTPVEIAATFPTAGKLDYVCGMDMIHGTLTVQ